MAKCSRIPATNSIWILVTVLLAVGLPISAPEADAQEQRTGAEMVEVVTPFVYRADLRRTRRAPEWISGDPVVEIPRRFYPRPGDIMDLDTQRAPDQGVDPLMEAQSRAPEALPARTFSEPEHNFNGQGFSGVNPPDTVGDAGLRFYIQMINASGGAFFTVYNKSDGTVEAGPIELDSMGSGNCSDGKGDPIVLFDPLSERWLLSEFSNVGNRLCVYISQTSNPVTGGWFNYSFQAPAFPDYPKYGVWSDAYYVTSNENPDPAVYALERSKMLTGAPAGMLRFTAPSLGGFGFQALTPADLDGSEPPPTGSAAYFIRHRDDERHNPGANDPTQDFLELWEFSADFADPAAATFTGPFNVAITEFDSGLCGFVSFGCFPQPGFGPDLDPLREVVMRRLQYRNFGDHETLVGNMVTDVDGTDRGGIRWYELRKSGAGAWQLHQEGTYSPTEDNRFMASIGMDGDGNIAMGYSVVSESVFPSLRYAGRFSDDPLGVMTQGEMSLAQGVASNSSNRYGDYSSLSVDPEDDCTFWFTGQFNTSGQWSTRIGTFSFSECGQQEEVFDLAGCQAFCESVEAQCATVGLPESVCEAVVDRCQQLCLEPPA